MAGLFHSENNRFYRLYQDPVQKLVDSVNLLDQCLTVHHSDRGKFVHDISVLEHEANDDRKVAIDTINSAFITPFDRNDMLSLVNAIESSIGYVDKASELLLIIQFDDIEYLPKNVVKQMELMKESAIAIKDGIDNLKNITKLDPFWDIVKENEHLADGYRRKTLTKLYNLEKDPMRVFKIKEIIEAFEEIIDSFLHIVHVVEYIAFKEE